MNTALIILIVNYINFKLSIIQGEETSIAFENELSVIHWFNYNLKI